MVTRYWCAPAILFALQTAPVGVGRDSNGRLRIAFGGQFGNYENLTVNCSGEIEDRQKVNFSTVGGEAEAWITPELRILGFGGKMTATGTSGPDIDDPYEGWFGGGLVAFEERQFGLGLGASVVPSDVVLGTSWMRAMPYARFGVLDKVHVRLEVNGPGNPGGPPELVRISVARGYGAERRTAWKFGWGMDWYPTVSGNWLGTGAFSAAVMFPLNGLLDLGLSGAVHGPSGVNAGVIGRVQLGKMPHP